jgi:hypothetical protein
VSCGRDLRLRFILQGRDRAGLNVIVRKLNLLKKQAQQWLLRQPTAPRDQRLWFRVFAGVDCTLRGTTLEIKCLVTQGQLD